MAYVIAEPCVDVKDTACVAVCPVDCIYEFEGENQLYIHPEECIDCDACRPECPVEAIFPLEDVPAQWQNYIDVNRAIFETHSPADRVGDHGAEGEGAEAAAGGSDGAAAPVSSAEAAELTTLLKALGAREIGASKALEDVVPLLEKLGIEVTSE